jgi:hypothetical protein
MRRPAMFAAALPLVALVALLGTVTAPAHAADDCPEGDWFCEPAPAAEPAPAEPGPAPARERAEREGRRRERPASPQGSPFEPPPPPGMYEDRRVNIDVENVRPARPRHRRGFREWGVNLHANIGLMGNDDDMSPDAGMNGFGGALRFRPIPHIAIEGALEVLWGTDYNGFQRFEQALLVNGLFYANPRSAVQLYGIAGLGFGAAFLDSGVAADGLPVLRDETYAYTGGQLGVGVEGRVTRHFALGADLIGFLRWRTDRHAGDEPEFIDPVSGRTTNTSGGGLLRLGATFYW